MADKGESVTGENAGKGPGAEDSAGGRQISKLFGGILSDGIRAGWRAATSDGQGAFTGAMLLFGIAAFSFHSALVPQTERERRLEETAGHRQESLEGEHYPVLASLVSAGRSPRLCFDDARARALRGELVTATRQVETALAKPPALDHAPAAMAPICPGHKGFGPAWTDRESLQRGERAASTLFVPSTLLLGVAENQEACRDPHKKQVVSDTIGQRFGEFPARSRALEQIDLPRLTSYVRMAGLSQASAYFISPEGVTRSLPAGAPTDFITHYLNNGASYFFHALEGKQHACGDINSVQDVLPGFVTYPYLDIFGGGLEETYCAPVTDRGTVGGVLCFDLGHNEAEILDDLATKATAALDLSVVRLKVKSAAPDDDDPSIGNDPACPDDPNKHPARAPLRHTSVDVRLCEESRFPGGCPDALRSKGDPSALRTFADWYYDQELRTNQQLRHGGVYLEHRKDDDRADHNIENDIDRKFGVVVYHDVDQDYWDVAIGDLRQIRNRDYAALILCAVCVLGGVVVLVISYRRKMSRREAYLARGLAYGLIQISAAGHILGANDRAEALLGIELPRLGIQASVELTHNTFDGFIDHTLCVLIPLSEALSAAHCVQYAHVRSRSLDGMTTDFYAYLKSTREWIRVSTRIVVLPSREEQLFYAFDSHVCSQHRAFLEDLHA